MNETGFYAAHLKPLLPFIGFAVIVFAAIAFTAWPLRRSVGPRKGRAVLALALGLFLLGVGGGTYWMVGRPYLALRAARPIDRGDINGLAPLLIERLRKNPQDEQAWVYLGQVYLSANAPGDAAEAFGHALAIQRAHRAENPLLDIVYGEALINAEGGTVSDKALGAFTAALAADPQSVPARYYLGLAHAQHGDKDGAARFWKSLLDEVPTTAPLHQELVDRLASIGAAPTVAGSNGAPDISAMVAGLAARLQKDPNDPAGWLRLIRAYSVLGDKDKAKDALATARKTVGASPMIKSALDSEAQELKLE